MYSTLDVYGYLRTTTNEHFPCPSLGLPSYHVPIADSPRHVSTIQFDMHPKIIPSSSSLHKDDEPRRKVTPLPKYGDDDLLPVMDPRFNLREICKQCVLLEDHLTHDDKRCTDCCTKHFLALEALAEEALTLDKQGMLGDDIKSLPRRIRELELMWIQHPSKCSEISQKLREIRKQFQQQTFAIIQNGCDAKACSVRL